MCIVVYGVILIRCKIVSNWTGWYCQNHLIANQFRIVQIGVVGPLFPKQTLNIDHFFVTKPHHPIINVSNRTRLSSRSLPLVDFLWRLLFLKTRGRVARFCLTDLKGLSNPKMAFTFYRRVSDLKKIIFMSSLSRTVCTNFQQVWCLTFVMNNFNT